MQINDSIGLRVRAAVACQIARGFTNAAADMAGTCVSWDRVFGKIFFFSQEPPMACEQRPFIASFPHFVQITASVIEEGRLNVLLSYFL